MILTNRFGRRASIGFGALAVITAMAVHAEEPATYLDEVILVGTGLPTEVRDSPASVNVVGQEQIKRVPPTSVARILAEIPGVSVFESGIDRIKIRGEDSQRVAVLIDGQRIADHSTYGTPILISPAAIERIEVVRGSSSVVSGNRAIGGVVNIITKRGADVPLQVTASTGYFSAQEGWNASLNLQGSQGNLDYRLTFSETDLGDQKTATQTLVPSGIRDRDLSLHLGYEMGNHYVSFRAQDFDLSSDVYTGIPGFTIDLPKRDLRKYALFYEGTDLAPWVKSLKVNAFSQTIDREFLNNVVTTTPGFPPTTTTIVASSTDEQMTSGFAATAELQLIEGQRTIVGFEFEDDRLKSDKASAVTIFPGPPFPITTTRYGEADIKTTSVFAQHEFSIGENLTATVGARYYNVQSELSQFIENGVAQPTQSNSDSRVLGSVGLVYKPNDDTTFRANLSQGYTYPSLSQLYLTTSGGGVTIIGNSDLQPETSTTLEAGVRLDRGSVILDGTLFYTDASNYLASSPTGTPREEQWQNIDKVRSWGAELGVEFQPVIWELRPYASLAYIEREYRYANGFHTTDSGVPNWSGTIGVRRDWALGNVEGEWDLFLTGESAAIERADDGSISDSAAGFTTLNLRGSAMLSDNVALNFEIGNITDRSYDQIDQIPGAGRNISVSLTATF